MRCLTCAEVLALHRAVMQQTRGAAGVRDLGALESALAQPRMAFNGQELCPTVAEKAAALCFSIIQNHPFVDGNKRVGHAAMEVFFLLNGLEIHASVDEQESMILRVASGEAERHDLAEWLRGRIGDAGENPP